jgi:hypothetical protein
VLDVDGREVDSRVKGKVRRLNGKWGTRAFRSGQRNLSNVVLKVVRGRFVFRFGTAKSLILMVPRGGLGIFSP